MNGILTIIKILGGIILFTTASFSIFLFAYMHKQVKWESGLKNYKISALGYVVNPQGFILTTPRELLEELQGVEERIVK